MSKALVAMLKAFPLPQVSVHLRRGNLTFTSALSSTAFLVPGTQAVAYGVTTCVFIQPGRKPVKGIAYCSLRDGFVSTTGRKVAVTHALRAVKSKAVRTQVWEDLRLSGVV